MAIDLPPPMPPQLTPVQEVSHHSSNYEVVSGKVGDFELRISGEHGLSRDELSQLLENAKTPSQAILLANAASYKRGHLLVRYLYSSPNNGIITVHAYQHSVGEIKADEALKSHFADLVGERDLSRREFKTPAVLAELYANRRDADYSVSYEHNTATNTLDLVFTEQAQKERDATTVFAQLGNQGSRFAGRYFFDIGMVHDFASGTEFGAAYETAITEWGEARDGKDYHRFQVKLDHPFSFGLYGLDASHTEYTQEFAVTTQTTSCTVPILCLPVTTTTTSDIELEAEIQQLGFNGSQVLSSDINHRLLLNQRLEWIDSTIDSDSNTALQDERYGTAELGATYYRSHSVNQHLFNWKAGLAVEGGLSGDTGTLGTEGTTTGVSIGKRTAEFLAIKPSASASYWLSENTRASVKLNAQLADEQLPQQQQWVLGGIDRISAYLPGVLVGDSGYHIDASLNYRWALGAFVLDAGIFAEYGAAQYENASGAATAGDVDYSKKSSIADGGLRATLTAWDWLSVRGVIAESFSEDNIDETLLERSESKFFVVVKAKF